MASETYLRMWNFFIFYSIFWNISRFEYILFKADDSLEIDRWNVLLEIFGIEVFLLLLLKKYNFFPKLFKILTTYGRILTVYGTETFFCFCFYYGKHKTVSTSLFFFFIAEYYLHGLYECNIIIYVVFNWVSYVFGRYIVKKYNLIRNWIYLIKYLCIWYIKIIISMKLLHATIVQVKFNDEN